MNISVFGLGYVGAVTAGCLAEQGHVVVGVDVQAQKVELFNQGLTPIIEPGLDPMLRQAHASGRLRATTDYAEALEKTDVSLVCVGTPSQQHGALDLSHVRQVTRQIGETLQRRPKPHYLIFRSTMLPGSTRQLVKEFLSDLMEQGCLEVLFYPEFLRESTAVADFRNPSLRVVGTRDGASFTSALKQILGNSVTVVDWSTAEMLKYACNAFHATKIAFANEIGRLSKQMGIDAQAVMHLVCQDQRLNISPAYLRPGNPFGGSCLPKDVRALEHRGRQLGMTLPLIESLIPSNQDHLQSLLQIIAERGKREVIILGLAFKANTDDLRESSMVELAQHLSGHGYEVRIYDPQLNLSGILGSNRRTIEVKMPRLASLLKKDLPAALGQGGLVLAAQRCVAVSELAQHVTRDHLVLDINGWPELKALPAAYEGFCW